MAIQQISVFVENKQGKLVQTVQLLAANNINIRAMSIADTKDFGILRMITSDNAKTKEVLSNDTVVNTAEVIAVKMADRPGALYKVVDIDRIYILVINDVQQVVQLIAAAIDDAQTVARKVVGIEGTNQDADDYTECHRKGHKTTILLVIHIFCFF